MISLGQKKVLHFTRSRALLFFFFIKYYCILKPEEYPVVVVAIFVETATPFMEEFWKKFVDLVYPKEQFHLFIFNKG